MKQVRMRRWRTRKTAKSVLASFVKAGLGRCNQQLMVLADRLQKITNRYSPVRKKLLLLLFTAVFAAASTLIMIHAIRAVQVRSLPLTRIKMPPIETGQGSLPVITNATYVRLRWFKDVIDSLGTTAAGAKQRDSLLSRRPLLMDSVNFLINLYLEQIKTKQK